MRRYLLTLAVLPFVALAASAQCGPTGCATATARVGIFSRVFAPPAEMFNRPAWSASSSVTVRSRVRVGERRPVRNVVARVFGRCR